VHVDYIEEAKICIQSIRKNGCFNGEIYLFTDINTTIENVNVIKITDVKNVYDSASYRTRILEHNIFNNNDIILYLDTDIVVLQPIDILLNIVNDKICVYGYPNRLQNETSFAGLITKDINIINKPAFCSGILLFKVSDNIKNIFNQIWNYYQEQIKNNNVNSCWEQPVLCYILIKYNIYDILLNEYVYEERQHNKITEKILFNHFCGIRGPDRKKKMKKYINP
jgi:lipopolysaccharide biosynthesis glycosyltransferase